MSTQKLTKFPECKAVPDPELVRSHPKSSGKETDQKSSDFSSYGCQRKKPSDGSKSDSDDHADLENDKHENRQRRIQKLSSGQPVKVPPSSSSKAIKKNNGRWSQKEKLRFLQALQKYKRNWKQVELHVKTRTSTQARSHAQKFFQKLKKRGVPLWEVFATLPKTDINDDDSFEPILESKNEFLHNYLIDGNFDMDYDNQADSQMQE